MYKNEIAPNVYSVGVVDWNLRKFHGFTYNTSRGSTYNAYLVLDDKITLIDTVYGTFSNQFIQNIKRIVDPSRIDYIIANHVETDHSGALPELLKLCPQAKIFGTAKCKEGLYKHYFQNWDFQIVKTGDKLSLGHRNLTFIEAPMLHWPDSMYCYLDEPGILFSNDTFGQHYATSELFDDEVNFTVLIEEAKKYYANILWPFSSLVLRKLDEIQKMNLPIKIVATSHGICWRKEIDKIFKSYLTWANNESANEIVIVYETMWQSTYLMAKSIVDGIRDEQVKVKLYDITCSDRTEIVNDMLTAKGYIIGSATHDNNMLPTLAGFMDFFRGLKPKKRLVSSFGSYGWSGGAVPQIETIFKELGLEITIPSVTVKYVPDDKELRQCYELGRQFAVKIKSV